MNNKTLVSVAALVVLLVGAFLVFRPAADQGQEAKVEENNMNDRYWLDKNHALPSEYQNKKAVVQTSHGTFEISFFDEASLAVENFIRLSNEAKYNGAPFHRVMKNFMIQSGDYTNGNGTGGGSIWQQAFADQLTLVDKVGYKRGVVAMANSGANTNGSQFFVMHQDYPLAPNYVIFGEVTEGLETIDKIANIPVLETPWGEPSVPTEKIVIEKVTIENR